MEQKWWQKSVIYQIYPKSFNDSNGDGIGDLKGLIEKLDYLAFLGIDMIWICPIYPSPMDDNGYDISDYQDIAAEFGSLQDFETLVAEAKKRNMKLMMDLVINHTSDEHKWFIESKASLSNPKRDWYIWRNPKEDGSAPNNWRSIFGGSAWEWDQTTEQFYLHTFSKKQPDLNWENEEVRETLFNMVNWWVEKGVDGFRVDAITFIKKGNLTEHLPTTDRDGLALISHACLNQTGIGDFLTELKQKTFANFDLVTVAEAPGVKPEAMPSYIGDNGYFDMLFEFDHVDLDIGKDGKWFEPVNWSLSDLKTAITKSQTHLNESGWGALYLENHDQPRSLNKFLGEVAEADRSKAAKMLATFYFLLKGTPFIYQGQELGMTNVQYESIDVYDDLASTDQYEMALQAGLSSEEALQSVWRRSRDNSRTPMQWDETTHAGFTSGQPWLPVNENYKAINVEQQLKDPSSVLRYYKKLIELRKTSEYSETIVNGVYQSILTENDSILGYTREYAGQKLVVLANFTNTSIQLEELAGNPLLTNYESPFSGRTLRPFEAVVLEA